MSAYSAVLANGQARLLILAMIPVRFGYAMAGLAMVLLIRDRTGSFALAGLGLGLFSLGAGLLSPLRGHLVDTMGQTKPLMVYLPVFCASFAILSFARDATLLIVLCTISGCMSPPLLASSRALWRPIVGPDLVRSAYALDSIAMQASQVLGPALTAALVAAWNPEVAIWAVTIMVAIGGVLFILVPASRAWTGDRNAAGFRGAIRSPGIRVLLAISAAFGTAWGALCVGLPAISVEAEWTLNGGILLALLALGSVLGGTWAGARAKRGPVRSLITSLALLAVALFLAAIPAPLPVLLTLLVIAGLGMGPAQVFLLELIDRVSPAGSAVTAFASVVAIEGAFVGLGAYLAGRAADGGWAYAGLVVAGLAELVAVAIVVAVQPILNAKRQWAAESQESPTPTETSNGTSNA